MDDLDIGQDKTRVAFNQYSNSVYVEFSLSKLVHMRLCNMQKLGFDIIKYMKFIAEFLDSDSYFPKMDQKSWLLLLQGVSRVLRYSKMANLFF